MEEYRFCTADATGSSPVFSSIFKFKFNDLSKLNLIFEMQSNLSNVVEQFVTAKIMPS